LAPSPASGWTVGPRARRCCLDPLGRAGVLVLDGVGNRPAWGGTRGAGAERRRDRPDARGDSRLPGHGGRTGKDVVSGPAGGGVRERKAGRRRTDFAGRSTSGDAQNRRTLV